MRRWQDLLSPFKCGDFGFSDFQSTICILHSAIRRPMREVISTPDAPKAIGPYSQAISAKGLVFISGQVAIDPATQQVMDGDITVQTERVMQNLSAILVAAESNLEKVLRCTVFLKS